MFSQQLLSLDSNMHRSSASSASETIICPSEMLDREPDTGISSRREMVNLLDAEPLLAYLVQNGVLSSDERNDILNSEDDTVKQNMLLLKFIETRPNGMKLFTNVLRTTGQHYLANLVDDGIRIKALSSSGEFSRLCAWLNDWICLVQQNFIISNLDISEAQNKPWIYIYLH